MITYIKSALRQPTGKDHLYYPLHLSEDIIPSQRVGTEEKGRQFEEAIYCVRCNALSENQVPQRK